jgi:hypothetical protein
MISSSVWGDEKFITFNDVTRLVWFGLITNVDDQGRMQDNPLLIKAKLFPADRKSAGSISNAIDQLSDAGMEGREPYKPGIIRADTSDKFIKYYRQQVTQTKAGA